jgi:hypothetical protein
LKLITKTQDFSSFTLCITMKVDVDWSYELTIISWQFWFRITRIIKIQIKDDNTNCQDIDAIIGILYCLQWYQGAQHVVIMLESCFKNRKIKWDFVGALLKILVFQIGNYGKRIQIWTSKKNPLSFWTNRF